MDDDDADDTPAGDPRDVEWFEDRDLLSQPDPYGSWADYVYDFLKAKSEGFE